MAKRLFSIREKITWGFYLQLIFILCTIALPYGIVRKVDQKVARVAIIDDFFNSALETRRFEKNYLLYRQQKDFEQNLAYQQRLTELLHKNQEEFRLFTTANAMERLEAHIDEYWRNMLALHRMYTGSGKGDAVRQSALEDKIRKAGKDLTDFAESVSSAERQSIRKLLDTTRRILLLSITILAVLAATVTILLQAFKRISGELKVRQQQLLRSEKLAALGTLLSGVAHELNNPLSNISTSAQILNEELTGGDLELKMNMLQQIDEQTDRARDIVRSLLEFSRTKTFNRQELSLAKLVNETIVLLRGQLPIGAKINVDLPAEITIFGDKQRLQQVLLNLLKNAIDAVVEADGHVRLSAHRIESGPGRKSGSPMTA
ncbi:MAG: histidine kinase dimerization/phospho-acceptor domain-containing protein [Deltaproteobacteria bacterium]